MLITRNGIILLDQIVDDIYSHMVKNNKKYLGN